MPNPLLPKIDTQGTLNVSALLASPTKLNDVLAKLTAEQLVMDAFFNPIPSGVSGGGVVYGVLKHGSNYLARDTELRAPGAEYIVSGSDMPMDLAVPQDWGSKIQILDEHRDRCDAITLANKLIQLSNTIARKIDQVALAAVDAALTKHTIAPLPGHDWSALVTVGPDTSLTPNANRPTADFANANLSAVMDDIGIKGLDTLVCHPQEHARLKIGYGTELAAVLASAGIAKVRPSVLVTPGTAYLVESGLVGRVAFERPMTTEVIDDRHHRAQWIQSYAVPAFAVSKPGGARKITGLAG
ncbi:major capsid protein [Nocardia concava]|uniref:major capsid protein n=1 Tax=Nocardia concava TaxID=257281 RepID=UPI0002E63A3C|nr:major capsid protein [Nocardia concava]